jgi:hypothetical protein
MILNKESKAMSHLGEEPGGNTLKEAAVEDRSEASRHHPQPCNDASGRVFSISAEEPAQDAQAVACFVERMLALPDEDPPGLWEEAMRDLDAHRPFRKLFEGFY